MFWNRIESPVSAGHTTANIFSLMGDNYVAPELDQTVVISNPDEPGVATFVNPQNSSPTETDGHTEYDWIRVEDRGISIERAAEGSSRVTDAIRQAARMAWGLKVQRETAAKVA